MSITEFASRVADHCNESRQMVKDFIANGLNSKPKESVRLVKLGPAINWGLIPLKSNYVFMLPGGIWMYCQEKPYLTGYGDTEEWTTDSYRSFSVAVNAGGIALWKDLGKWLSLHSPGKRTTAP